MPFLPGRAAARGFLAPTCRSPKGHEKFYFFCFFSDLPQPQVKTPARPGEIIVDLQLPQVEN